MCFVIIYQTFKTDEKKHEMGLAGACSLNSKRNFLILSFFLANNIIKCVVSVSRSDSVTALRHYFTGKQHSLGPPVTAEVTQETHCSSLSVSGAKIPVYLSSVT